MKRSDVCKRLLLALIALLVLTTASRGETATSAGSMVATVHPMATDAAIDVLRRGGNAIDAAVAAAVTLGVVDGQNSGIGGGCLILIRRFDGELIAIDGRETAGERATRDMYLRNGEPQAELSQTGPLAVGVPGALAAYQRAVQHYGRTTLAELLLPAAEIAERGFPISASTAGALKRSAEDLARYASSRAVLLKADGSPRAAGEILRQGDLARTYRAIAEHGIDWFYRGPFARRVAAWMANHGGILTCDDFARYRARRREPICTTYRAVTIVGFPPPSSGGVHVAQILNMLERFDLRRLHEESPAAAYHVIAEAMKLAFADRAHWLGDPDFADVPRGLTDKQYASRLAKRIDPAKTIRVPHHGRPPMQGAFGRHTTHIATVDARGNWVALTATINTGFGSKVIVPGTGVVLNDEMDDFSIAPGTPNAADLVGADANAVGPGKRPLSSMSPTIVLRDGKPILTIGAAGGPTIITQVVLGIVRHCDLGMSLPDALATPRIHHQWKPDVLRIERALDESIAAGLQQRGHSLKREDGIGVSQAIGLSKDGKTLIGVHDPRVTGKAAGP